MAGGTWSDRRGSGGRRGGKASARRAIFAAALLATGWGLVASLSASAQEGAPGGPDEPGAVAERCRGAEHRQFDFWLGRWEVRNPEGELVGHNEIARVAGGCALLERWRGRGGGTGVSVNTYDPELGRWTQRWVGTGATLWLEGGIEAGPEGIRMVLAGTRPRTTPRGEVRDRLIWTPLPDGRVRQVWESSPAGSETWSEVFVGLYSRVDAPAPPGDAGARPDANAAGAATASAAASSSSAGPTSSTGVPPNPNTRPGLDLSPP